ncbi:MAG: protein phosphatase CheZ [Nitrospirota bacterium]
MDDVNRQLYEELGQLARFIETAMRKLEEAGAPVMATTGQLSEATMHLTDLSRLTEEGAHEVMRLAEAIQDNHARVMKALADVAGPLAARADTQALAKQVDEAAQIVDQDDKRLIDLMTALSFQDLVAQRVKKLAALMNDVEHKLLEMIVVFGLAENRSTPAVDGKAGDILKQLEASKSTALKQELVDDILTQFGFN